MTRYLLVELAPDGSVRWLPVPTPRAGAILADRARWVRFVTELAEEECGKEVAAAFARRVDEANAQEVSPP